MKTMHGIRNAIVAACVMTLGGCLEIETTTTVHPDGSVRREIRRTGDSAEVFREVRLFAMDSTWSIEQKKTDTTWESIASKEFADASALESELNRDPGRSLRVRASLEKHFAWFTTTFEYRETIVCYNQFHAVPITDMIPQKDLDRVMHHEIEGVPYPSPEDSLQVQGLSERTEEWDHRNKFKAYHALFVEGARSLHDATLIGALTPAMEETLYVHTLKSMNAGALDTLPSLYEKVLRTPLVKSVFALQREAFAGFAEKLTFQEEMLGAGYKKARIVMPGLLTATNARSIEGNRLTWEEFLGASYVADYTMWARSRVVNWWAVVLTGAVVLFLAVIPLVWFMRRRSVVVNEFFVP
jgi:hypothetical protein